MPTFYQAGKVGTIRRLFSYRGAPSLYFAHRVIRPMHYARDTYDMAVNGAGMVEGTVTVNGIPARQRVVALSGRGFTPKEAAYSDPATGKFRIYPLAKNHKYLVIAADLRTRFNAVVADGVEPVNWEDA
jgi:hypothetical protein